VLFLIYCYFVGYNFTEQRHYNSDVVLQYSKTKIFLFTTGFHGSINCFNARKYLKAFGYLALFLLNLFRKHLRNSIIDSDEQGK